MKKWAYWVFGSEELTIPTGSTLIASLQERLNVLGDEGWELVGTTEVKGTIHIRSTYILKREIEQ